MDLWHLTETRMRHDDALHNARRSRLARLASSGRSTRIGIRIHIAAGAQALSDALAMLAHSLRNGEAH